MSNEWGGKRAGAGRPRNQEKKAVEITKVVRMSEKQYYLWKTGKFNKLIALLSNCEQNVAIAKKAGNYKDYEKLSMCLKAAKKILGGFDKWLE